MIANRALGEDEQGDFRHSVEEEPHCYKYVVEVHRDVNSERNTNLQV